MVRKHEYYISEKGVENLKNYKYSGSDNSLAGIVLKPFWNFVAKLFPRWIAPNLITMISFLCLLMPFGYYVIWNYDFVNHGNDVGMWVAYNLTPILIFMYQTLDSVDGIQARRTGASSPMGELFDHGLDALNSVFVAWITLASIQFETDFHKFYLLFAFIYGLFGSFLSIWEAYCTNFFRMGYLNAVCEIHYVSMTVVYVSYYNPEFWDFNFFNYFNILESYEKYGDLRMFFCYFIITVVSLNLLYNPYIVITSGGKNLIRGASAYLLSMIMMTITLYLDIQFYYKYTTLMLLMIGFILSYIQIRIIQHKLIKEKAILFYRIMIPFPIFILLFILGVSETFKLYYLIAFICYIFLMNAFFYYKIMNEIAEILDIYIFRIKRTM